jgi:hypothetical protein
MDLYCDVVCPTAFCVDTLSIPAGHHGHDEFPQQFHGETEMECRAAARKRGWVFHKNGRQSCPTALSDVVLRSVAVDPCNAAGSRERLASQDRRRDRHFLHVNGIADSDSDICSQSNQTEIANFDPHKGQQPMKYESRGVMERADVLDRLCQRTTNPTVLNALHACRDGHPLGRNNDGKWRNAYGLCLQHRALFDDADFRWLERRAHNSCNSVP